MPLISDYLIQKGEEDSSILHTKVSNINMRLFKQINAYYRSLIHEIANHMSSIMKVDFDDYGSKLKGLSGANIGIPFNITAIRVKDLKHTGGMPTPQILVQLNPKIVKHSKSTKVVTSNCGSLCLRESVKVARYIWVDIEYYNLTGEKCKERYNPPYSFTIQHEVDHNSGVLITDKIVKEV